MLTAFKYVSWSAIAGSLTLILTLRGTDLGSVRSANAAAPDPVAGFPLMEVRTVEFDVDAADLARLTPREQRDQLVDWLFVTVANGASRSTEEFNQATFDYQLTREGDLAAPGRLDNGRTRSLVSGDSDVIALIPPAAGGERLKDLARIADEHRKDLGAIPRRIIPIEYTIDTVALTATLRRIEPVAGDSLFTAAAGYHVRRVATLSDLRQFLASTNDITLVRWEGDALTLGGRALQGHARGIRVEDVAAIWQAERGIQQRGAAFERIWQVKENALNSAWRRHIDQPYEFDPSPFLKTPGLWPLRRRPGEYVPPLIVSSEAQLHEEGEKMRRAYTVARHLEGIVDGSGFSLDPAYDFPGLAALFTEETSRLVAAAGPGAPIKAEQVWEAQQGLQEEDLSPYFKLTRTLQHGGGWYLRAGQTLEDQLYHYQFQAARYDGELNGTEVGMVLYYTDLLAKLWAIDFMGSSPDRYIEDFRSMTRPVISPIFRAEVDSLTSTRLWFGHLDAGFQVGAGDSSLLFARNATRVYAASSDPLLPGVESPANAQSQAFLGWWNDHYEDVAGYEPQYERLNEIMKWSLVIGWLNNSQRGGVLEYLGGVRVDHSNWFPTWAKANQALRFRDWTRIAFLPRGYKGTRTEALPQLQSKWYVLFGRKHSLIGGVSLAKRSLFTESRALSRTVMGSARRARINYAKSYGGRSFELFDGTRYNLGVQSAGRAEVHVVPAPNTRFRGTTSELRPQELTRVASRSGPGEIRIETSTGAEQLSVFRIGETRNGFRVGLQGQDMARAHAFARRLSRSEAPTATLVGDPSVEAAFQLPGTSRYVVKLRDSPRWLQVEPEPRGSVALDAGWESRVADLGAPQSLRIRWLDGAGLSTEFTGKELRILPGATNEAPLTVVSDAAPNAEGLRNVSISTADGSVTARFDPSTGAIRVRYADLPASFQKDPGALAHLLEPTDIERIRGLAAQTKGPLTFQTGPRRAPTTPLLDDVRGQRYQKLANELAADPQAFKTRMAGDFTDRLRSADKLMRDGQFRAADEALRGAAAVHGSQPEILARQALAELGRDAPQRAAQSLNRLGGARRPISDRTAFFDEVNARYSRTGLSDAQRQNIEMVARYVDWTDLQAQRVLPHDAIAIVAEGDRLTLKLTTEAAFAAQPVSDLGPVLDGRAAVYVQDSPGLNNLDWGAGLSRSLRQVVSADMGTVIYLPRGDIAGFSPASIAAAGGKQYRLVNAPRPLPSFYRPRDGRAQCTPDAQERCDGVYLVTAGNGSR